MLADGMSKELVMKYTGLSLEQISNINLRSINTSE